MKQAFFWNTVSGLLMAFQSVAMLMVLMRVCDAAEAGIFTIAYANANLFLNIGKYGMRNYQVSDVSERFGFSDYLSSRLVSSLAMIVIALLYLAFTASTLGYSVEKVHVIVMMCLFKAVDSLEDVFHGDYQRCGHLEVAGMVLSFRLASTILVFCLILVFTGNQLHALTVSTIYTAAFFVATVVWARARYKLPKQMSLCWRFDKVWLLLKDCFPLFLAAFLLFYIGNAPKYAIDSCLSDVEQAYYGFIAMPVFVVGLLASFAYNPIVALLASMWAKGEKNKFLREFAKQVLIVFVITGICDFGTVLIGIPVLSWMYNADLSPYLLELIVLVTGGGFLALVSLFTMGLTILRKQSRLIRGYIFVSILGLLASNWFVQAWGVTGASWEYLVLMLLLAVWFAIVFVVSVFDLTGKLKADEKQGAIRD